MSQWKLLFTDKAEQDFAKLSKDVCRRISDEWQGFFK